MRVQQSVISDPEILMRLNYVHTRQAWPEAGLKPWHQLSPREKDKVRKSYEHYFTDSTTSH